MKKRIQLPALLAITLMGLTLGGCSGHQDQNNTPSSATKPQYHTGAIDKAELLSQYPVFADNKANEAANYSTKQAVALAKHLDGRKIVAVFGTWCPDSQREVPRLLTLLEVAKTAMPELEFELSLIAVAPSGSRDQALVERYRLTAVPTILLYHQDKELGRIIERPNDSLLSDLINMQ